jgi:hypothetical protein
MKIKVKDPKYAKRHLYGFHIPETYFIEGEPMDTPKWVGYPAITLWTGSAMRIVEKQNIIEIDDTAFSVTLSTPKKIKVVEVKGSKGDIYKVSLGEKYDSCTCQAFMFRKYCKHIKEAKVA